MENNRSIFNDKSAEQHYSLPKYKGNKRELTRRRIYLFAFLLFLRAT